MSEKNMQNVVKKYLKKVKSKLPEWLKDKKEHKEILAELEEHIWSKADELSETGTATQRSVQIAITHMGTPESIAKEYKRRGTPKVYITEELWPAYLKVIAVVFGVIVGIVLITQIIEFIFGNFNSILDAISGLQLGLLVAFVVITIIFVALSMEGYFPEDFKSKKTIEKEKQKYETAREEGIPISAIKIKPLKPYIKPAGEIVGGFIGIIFGVILIVQPTPVITNLIDTEFLIFLQFAGLFMVAQSALGLIRGLIGNRQMIAHQIIHAITIIVKLTSISVVILMMNRPEIFPILVVDNPSASFVNIGIAPEFYSIFRVISWVIIAIIVLTTIENFIGITKAEKYKSRE